MSEPIFLFSIDFEEFESSSPLRFRKTPLPELTQLFLDFLKVSRMVTTFFVVGKVARAYPELISAIFEAGHELACHTDSHAPLNRLNPSVFREDLKRNKETLLSIVPRATITGFRAPILSLTASTAWAYPVLAELGFEYSSSVLPASHPLFGWPEFGTSPRQIHGIWEIPVSLGSTWGLRRIPFAAGAYFRCLPARWIAREFEQAKNPLLPIVGYFHPYDTDTHQQYVLHQELASKSYLNPFLYWGRKCTIPRLKQLIQNGVVFQRYDQYLRAVNIAKTLSNDHGNHLRV